MKSLALVASATLLMPAMAGAQQQAPQIFGVGVSSFAANPIRCRDTTVKELHQAQGDSMAGTGSMSFADGTAVSLHPGLNRVAWFTHVGDRVQVCLLHVPERSEWCNPDIDHRGRELYVYVYRIRGAFIESLGEHGCGGA